MEERRGEGRRKSEGTGKMYEGEIVDCEKVWGEETGKKRGNRE